MRPERLWSEALEMDISLLMGALTSLLRLNFPQPVGIAASWPCIEDGTQYAALPEQLTLPNPALTLALLFSSQLSRWW